MSGAVVIVHGYAGVVTLARRAARACPFGTDPDPIMLDTQRSGEHRRRMDAAEADPLLDVIRAAQRLVVACDAVGEDVAGTYVMMAIDVLRASPRLDDAIDRDTLLLGQGSTHALGTECAQPDV